MRGKSVRKAKERGRISMGRTATHLFMQLRTDDPLAGVVDLVRKRTA